MMRFRDLSMFYKLIIMNAGFMLLLVGVLTVVLIGHARKEFIEDVKRDGRLMTAGLAHKSVLPILSENKDIMAADIEDVLSNPDVIYAAIYDSDGRLFVGKARKGFDKYATRRISTSVAESLEILSYRDYSHMYISVPVVMKGREGSREELSLEDDVFFEADGAEEIIGFASVWVSTENLMKRFSLASFRWAAIAAGLCIVGIALTGLILKRFLEPVMILSRGARRVAAGDLDVSIPVESADEIGRLSAIFNDMINNLKTHITKIQEGADEIESLAEGAMDGIFLIDGDCNILRVNREMERVLGYSRAEMIGENIGKYSELQCDELRKLIHHKGKGAVKDVKFFSRSGQVVLFEVSLATVSHEKKMALLGFARDVSERKKMESHLVQAEKLAATGRLAADIAHEVNNPLGIIKNYLAMIKRSPEFIKEDVVESLNIVDDEINRIAEIVKGLLAFSRPGRPEEAPVSDVNKIISQILRLISKPLEKQGIKIETYMAKDVLEAKASSDHIKQILINLINNAKDAMPDGGVLRIRAGCDSSGKGIIIEVEDSGYGVIEDSIHEVFSPFYTTKEVKGTGLGLSVSYGIVKDYGGSIKLENRKEGGVSVRVLLPGIKEGSADE